MSIHLFTRFAIATENHRWIYILSDLIEWPQSSKPFKDCSAYLPHRNYGPLNPVSISRALLVCHSTQGASWPSSDSNISEGDRVYINGKKPRLSKPLEKGGEFGVRDGFILHNEIIGATPSQRFVSNKGKTYQISLPDLDTYISSMPRKVTPVREWRSERGSEADSEVVGIWHLCELHCLPFRYPCCTTHLCQG